MAQAAKIADLQKQISELQISCKSEITQMQHYYTEKFEKMMEAFIRLQENLPKLVADAVSTAISTTAETIKDAIISTLPNAKSFYQHSPSATFSPPKYYSQTPLPLFQVSSNIANCSNDRSEFEKKELEDRKNRKSSAILVNFQIPPIIAENQEEMSNHLRNEVAKYFPVVSNAVEVEFTGNELAGKPRLLRLKFSNAAECENFKSIAIGQLRDNNNRVMIPLQNNKVKVVWDKTFTQLRAEQYWRAAAPPDHYLDQILWTEKDFDGQPIFRPQRDRPDNHRPMKSGNQGNNQASQ